MTYDLRRLRRKGIIDREPNSRRYVLTPYGQRVALFFTKLDARVFRPVFASFVADDPAPRPLAMAFHKVDDALEQIIKEAQLALAS